MYNLGKNLHTRYYRLLPKDGLYSKEEIVVQSSNAERCIMSAQSLMAAFMEPLENRNPLPIPWQPIPIRSEPRTQDYLLAQKKPCKKYDEMLKNLYDNPPADVVEMMQQNEQLFKMLTRNTGQNITTITDVELLFNTLQVQHDAQLALPDWTEKVYPDKMLPMAKRSLALFTETQFMKRIKGGIFISEVIENMSQKRMNSLPSKSLFVYIAHDVTLSNVMRALGVTSETSEKPDYASALVFELHHSVLYENDLEVQVRELCNCVLNLFISSNPRFQIVYYFNSEDKFPKVIPIPGCERPCSLTDFTKTYQLLMVNKHNFEELCQVF